MTMKRIVLFLFLTCLSQFNFAQTAEEIKESYPNNEIISVISYNIWCGFEDLKDVVRMKKTAAWLKEKDPEVVALQELCAFNEAELLKFAKMYGHNYAVIQKEDGYPVGITSKRPIQKVYVHKKDMGHGFLHVQTYDMDMIVLHLTPFSCVKRLDEARIVTDYMEEKQLDNCLVMGDFNAHSPYDAEELEQHTELIRSLSVYGVEYKDYNNMRGKLLDYSVQSNFLALPLEDIVRLYVPVKDRMTYPAFNFSKQYKGKDYLQQAGERIDYIYVTPKLIDACIDAHVWNGEDTKYLSDHYPIGINMFIPKK